jgi:hypothetical protein
MRRRLSGLRMVVNRPPCDEDFDSASSQFDEVFGLLSSCNSWLLTPEFLMFEPASLFAGALRCALDRYGHPLM